MEVTLTPSLVSTTPGSHDAKEISLPETAEEVA